jgi:seryl-tRNA synthetase
MTGGTRAPTAQPESTAALAERIAAATAHRDELSRRREALESRIESEDQALGRAFASGGDGSAISARIAELQIELRGVTRAIPIVEGEITELATAHESAVADEAARESARLRDEYAKMLRAGAEELRRMAQEWEPKHEQLLRARQAASSASRRAARLAGVSRDEAMHAEIFRFPHESPLQGEEAIDFWAVADLVHRYASGVPAAAISHPAAA